MLYNLQYPALILLFGLVFGLAGSFFLGFTWSKWMTILIYLISSGWTIFALSKLRTKILPATVLDKLGLAFVITVLFWLFIYSGPIEGLSGSARYFVPLVIVSFLLGRTMLPKDINRFMVLVRYAGLVMVILLLLNYWTETNNSTRRWSFFGYDHSPLLIANLLVISLFAFSFKIHDQSSGYLYEFFNYLIIGATTCLLVWISGRGWLLAGITTLTIITITFSRSRQSFYRLFIVWLAATLSITVFNLGVNFGQLLQTPSMTFEGMTLAPSSKIGLFDIFRNLKALQPAFTGPILGEESCGPVRRAIHSVAIRHVLYTEAFEIFKLSPIIGVGPGDFGHYSCTGPGGFPHSTLLQAFSELGLIGGLIFVSLHAFAGMSLLKFFFNSSSLEEKSNSLFALAMFLAYLIADQIYGNYFMMAGTSLMIGFAASLQSNRLIFEK